VRPASKHQVNSYVRPFLASAMVAGGLLQLAAPIYAAGTAAGADISNTATASYEDPNDTSATPAVLNTISNTVSIKVEKVAGIFIESLGATDVTDPGKNKPGDTINFDFLLTNKGNSAVRFSIPGIATVNTAGDFQKVQYFIGIGAPGADAQGYKDITGGATDPAVMPVVAVDGTMKARVVVVVRAGTAANTPLDVQLGKTATAPAVGTPVDNVTRANDAGDVYTIDITNDNALAPLGNAVNGVREAAATQTINVSAENKAFVDIKMSGAATFVDPTDPTKNKITYDINVKVDPTAPTSGPDLGKNPSDLGATLIKLDSTATGGGVTTPNRVLISNPVPVGTTPTELIAPTGWTPVYSTSPVGTPIADIVWKTGPLPTTGDPITSVGFIKNDELPLAKDPAPYTGFKVVLQTTSASPTEPTTVNNVANVFGTTPKADGTADPTKPVQDQTGTPDAPDTVPGTPIPVSVTITPQTPRSLLTGPVNKPGASGPDSTQNTDYTNKSAEIKVSDAKVVNPISGELEPLATPQAVSFNNTVKNTGTGATDIYLLPTAPAVKTDLPTDTVVVISFGSETRTYTYNSATGTYTVLTTDAGKLPIVIPNVATQSSADYGVSVKLPPNTAQLKGYTAPITAFADTTAPTAGATTVPATAFKNTTIDTVYTGYIKLSKEARILNSASDANAAAPTFSSGALTTKPLPGQFIQYRIKYENISTGGGTDSIGLNAGKLNIVEDGAAGGNTWAAVTTNVTGKASDTKGGNIKFFNGAASSPDVAEVSKYVVDMSAASPAVVIAPQESGSFSFLREVK
jgi:hypothetical protein